MKAASSDAFIYETDEIVSSDVIGVPAGSIFDATQTIIMEANGGQLVKTVLGMITSTVSLETW